MKRNSQVIIVICFFVIFLIASSCITDFNDIGNSPIPIRNGDRVSISQGIWGDVWFLEGNFMPGGGAKGSIKTVRREIRIHEKTPLEDVVKINGSSFYSEVKSKLIATVWSDVDGFFEVRLDPGIYSVFVIENSLYYATRNNGIYINPVVVSENQVAELLFQITYKAGF